MFQFWVVSLAFGVATFTVACGRQQVPTDKTVQATVDANVAQSGAFSLAMPDIEDAAVAARVKEFHVLVSGKSINKEIKVPYSPKELVSIPAIPAGEVSVRVRLIGGSAEVIEEGEGKALIEVGQTASAQIFLKPVGDGTGSLVIEICRVDGCGQPIVEPPLPPADPLRPKFETQLREYSLENGMIDDLGQLSLLSYEKVTWNDGCMGIDTRQLCTMALVDGYRFFALNHKSRTTMRVVFHTDRDLRVILVASSLPEVTIPEIQ